MDKSNLIQETQPRSVHLSPPFCNIARSFYCFFFSVYRRNFYNSKFNVHGTWKLVQILSCGRGSSEPYFEETETGKFGDSINSLSLLQVQELRSRNSSETGNKTRNFIKTNPELRLKRFKHFKVISGLYLLETC